MRDLTCLALAALLAALFLSGCGGKSTAPVQTAPVSSTAAAEPPKPPKLPTPPPK
jgi:PBP1b-binding outer membrane lipoprotein LpoB